MSKCNEFTLDLDDCLARLAVPLQIALGLATGNNIHWKDWGGTNLENIYNVTTDQFIEIMIEGKVLEQALPINGIKDCLDMMQANGYAVNVCTKRAWHPNALELTKAWFDDFNLPYDTINIIGLHDNKSLTMKRLGSKCLIDDSISNCREAVDNGFSAKLIRMPWHPKVTDFMIVDHLRDALEIL